MSLQLLALQRGKHKPNKAENLEKLIISSYVCYNVVF